MHNPEALKAIAVLGIDTQTLSQYGNIVFNVTNVPASQKEAIEKDVEMAITSASQQLDILKGMIGK